LFRVLKILATTLWPCNISTPRPMCAATPYRSTRPRSPLRSTT
jgi:hypothetical protein